MRSYFGLVVLLAAILLAQDATSSVWNDWEGVEEAKPFKVIQYVDADAGDQLVVIDAGTKDGVLKGTVFKTYRSSTQQGSLGQGALWVSTGGLKAVEVQADYTVAAITDQAPNMARAFFPRFPGVMAGDVAVSQRVALVRKQIVTPERTLSYFDLFNDPQSSPQNFELSPEGRAQLTAAASEFGHARLSLLMVEGYTDHKGSTNTNQVESYQRALTIRQFLIHELGFDEKRVIAIGYGETEQVDASMAPGYVQANRRIVLKAIPVGD